MEGVGGELERLCCSPTGSLMKWSDFLVCSSQLLPPQSQDIWPWLFVLLGLPYLQVTGRTRRNKSKASGVSFSSTTWECERLSICCPPHSAPGPALIMLDKNQNAIKGLKLELKKKQESWNSSVPANTTTLHSFTFFVIHFEFVIHEFAIISQTQDSWQTHKIQNNKSNT